MGKRILFEIPAFMRNDPMVVTTTIGAEIKFSLRTRVVEVAEFRRSVALGELNKIFVAFRRGPQELSQKQLLGLARAVHELYVEAFEDAPGTKDIWTAHKALNRAVAEGRVSTIEPIVPGQMPHDQELALSLFGESLTTGINSLPRSNDLQVGLERRFGMLADWLLTHGLVVEPSTRVRLLRLIAHATDTGSRRIKDNIALDYTRHDAQERFASRSP